MRIFWLCMASMAFNAAGLTAQDSAVHATPSHRDAPFWRVIPARNVVYAELATFLAAGSMSINYERELLPNISVRGGIALTWGYSVPWMTTEKSNVSALVMANLFAPFAGNEQKMEIGAGVGIAPAWTDAGIVPALTLGYRYQSPRGGLMFRAGGTYVYGGGYPAQFSLGYAF